MIQDAFDLQLPSHDEIREALERICVSRPFKAAPRLAAFLRFVVEGVLDGRANTIKAYTVAVDALDRPGTFDPTTDAYVRVEAGRLRLALSRYYEAAGLADSVVIDLARGTYVPTFRSRPFVQHAHASSRRHAVSIERRYGLPLPELIPYTDIAFRAHEAYRQRHLLFVECHRKLAQICENTARLRVEFAVADLVMARSRMVLERVKSHAPPRACGPSSEVAERNGDACPDAVGFVCKGD